VAQKFRQENDMDRDILLGSILIACALGILIGLVAWSRHIIDTIARKKLGSARDIVRELRNGK